MESSDLLSSDPYKRAKAVQGLADALQLDTVQKAKTYLGFFLEKLSDQLSVGGALAGILKILENSTPELRSEKIAQVILEELNFSALPQNDRLNILKIYAILTQSVPLSKDYVQGYLHSVQAEKDPRCLLLGLRIMKNIMAKFNCSGLEEEIFDWTFAYFPITFKEKDNDPCDVTQKDLKNALMDCITDDLIGMGEFVVPFLMEKMESSLGLTKRDTMLFLGRACNVYHHDLFNKNLQKLWIWVKEEIYRPDNQENSMIALSTMKDILFSLSSVQLYSNNQIVNAWEKLVELMMMDVIESLESADHNLVIYTEKVFLTLAASSKIIFKRILKQYGQKILNLFNEESSATRKVVFCMFLYNLAKAAKIVIDQTLVSDDEELFEDLRNPLLHVFTLGVTFSPEYCQVRYYCLAGLSEMMIARILASEEINTAIIQLTIIMMKDSDEKNRKIARESLQKVGIIFPQNIKDHCLENIFQRISERDDISESSAIYLALTTISLCDQLFCFTLSFLNKNVIKAMDEGAGSYAYHLLNISRKLLDNRKEYQLNHELKNLIPECSDIFLLPILTAASTSLQGLNDDAMYILEKITNIIMRDMNSIAQVAVLKRYMSHITPSILDSNLIFPLVALICNARLDLEKEIDFAKILDILISSHASTVIRQSYISKCIASIINKFSIDFSNLKSMINELKGNIFSTSLSVDLRQEGVLLYAWITKSVILNSRLNRMNGMDMLADILCLHSDLDICHMVPEALDIIIADDSDGYLSKDSFCRISVLYKQKVFTSCIPILSNGIKNSLKGENRFYLLSMANILKNTPKAVLLAEAKNLIPFIIQSVDLNDPQLTLAALELLLKLIRDSSKVINQHISSVLGILSQKLIFEDGLNPLPVRLSACQSLSTIPKFVDYSLLHSFKSMIVRQLACACDDHKRLVRSAASKARNIWLML